MGCALLVALLSSLGAQSPAAADMPETLKTVMRKVVSRHPAVAAATAEQRALEEVMDTSFSGFLPVLSLDGGLRREWTDKATRSSTTDLWAKEMTATLRQPLFDGFEAWGEFVAARAAVAAAGHRLAAARSKAALEAAETYIEVLRSQELWETASAFLTSMRNQVHRLEGRAVADPGLRSEVLVGRNQMIEAQLGLEMAKASRNLAISRFIEFVGRPPLNLMPPQDRDLKLPSNQEEALTLARQSHPMIAAAAARVEEQKGLLTKEQASLFPDLNLELRTRRGDNIDGVRGRDNDVSLGLTLRYEFAAGGASIFRFRAGKNRVSAAVARERERRRRIDEAVLEAYQLYRREVEASAISAQLLTNHRQLIEVFRGQFEAGQRDIVDYVFVLKQADAARRAAINARFGRLTAAYRLLAATGQLAGGV